MRTNALQVKALASTVTKLQKTNQRKKLTDGNGLYLEVNGGARWLYSFRWDGKQTEMRIKDGSYPAMGLGDAREAVTPLREAVAARRDPRTVYAPVTTVEAAVLKLRTFAEARDIFYEHRHRAWSVAHAKNWIWNLRRNASALMERPIREITRDELRDLVKPVHLSKSESERKNLRLAICNIFDHEFEYEPNASTNLLKRLPTLGPDSPNNQPVPRPAMPWERLPEFMVRLRSNTDWQARVLELMIRTCTPRRGELMAAQWKEIVGDVWQLPASRIKSRTARWIPLTPEAVAMLTAMKPANAKPDDYLFPNLRASSLPHACGARVTIYLHKNLGEMDCTVHGFRGSFLTWAYKKYEGDLRMWNAARIAIDHVIEGVSKVDQRYIHDPLKKMDDRRALAVIWNAHLDAPTITPVENIDTVSQLDPALYD